MKETFQKKNILQKNEFSQKFNILEQMAVRHTAHCIILCESFFCSQR